jgi:hypothetical protein
MLYSDIFFLFSSALLIPLYFQFIYVLRFLSFRDTFCFTNPDDISPPITPDSIYLSIYLWLYSPFVGPWPLFQFLNPIHSRYDSLNGGSGRHKAATYTQNNTITD